MTTNNERREELQVLTEKLRVETESPEEFGRVMAQELAIANLIRVLCDNFPHYTPEFVCPPSTRAIVSRFGDPSFEQIVSTSFTDAWDRIRLIAGGAARG